MRYLMLLVLCALFSVQVVAQCPTPEPGHHRVQKGETLYRISKKYKVSISQLTTWNNLSESSVLSICQDLLIAEPRSENEGRPVSEIGFANMKKQEGDKHVIQEGETIAGLARLYGYTEEKFRAFNGLSSSEPAWPGLTLKTSSCDCPSLESTSEPSFVFDPAEGEATTNILGEPEDNSPPPTWEEAISMSNQPANTGTSSQNGFFEEDPFYEGTTSAPAPASYGQPVERIIQTDRNQSNQANKKSDKTPAGKTLDPAVKRSQKDGKGAPAKTYISAEDLLIRQKDNTNSNSPSTSTNRPAKTKDAARYMTADEISMVNEINLVRSNPAGYIKYVEMYKKDVAAGRAFGSIATCNELIAELRKTPNLSILQPTECLFNAAKKHGEDQRPSGTTDHVGSDGSYPWDRVKRECPYMTEGNENLVGGPASVRKAVLLLLVDDGIPNRRHRRTILNKDWKYVACYKIGQVGNMPNSWVQKFGR